MKIEKIEGGKTKLLIEQSDMENLLVNFVFIDKARIAISKFPGTKQHALEVEASAVEVPFGVIAEMATKYGTARADDRKAIIGECAEIAGFTLKKEERAAWTEAEKADSIKEANARMEEWASSGLKFEFPKTLERERGARKPVSAEKAKEIYQAEFKAKTPEQQRLVIERLTRIMEAEEAFQNAGRASV